MASNEVGTRIKIKAAQSATGLGVFLDGKQIGRIIGSRDPSGRNHAGYYLELNNGKQYGRNEAGSCRPGAYAYADDVKREIKGWIGREIIEQFNGGVSAE